MPDYHVLYRASDGAEHDWTEHAELIEAVSPDAAIRALRRRLPELKADTGALFVAISVSSFRVRRMRRQLVEKWALDDAELPDDEPQQGVLT